MRLIHHDGYTYLILILYPLYTYSRSLMPGLAKDCDPDDHSLNQTFRADKVEFLVVSRPATADEDARKQQLVNVNTADWDIPKDDEYEDAMGLAINEFTRADSDLIHVICWSSVNKTTDTGVFSIKTGQLQHIEDFRDIIRRMFIEGKCFETFPRLAILKKFQKSAYFPKSTSRIDNQRLCDWLMSCNEGLRGQIAPIDIKYFPACLLYTSPSPRDS